ncbi:hypothetical protein SKAU_G00420560 [Synaphobranchus kaupii]|uniref:Ig-like domain-containing protein n=1 Tax=Synaphobranchus kaupii TaxID=118154 RepID=A0A9Q1E6R1_SYNKA|nr:hypothetical protein SKAU_G00420560 [Synaphobranchus kaupii]
MSRCGCGPQMFPGRTRTPTPSLPLHVIFERGAPVMLEGDPVQMSCPSNPSKSPYTWYYLNRPSGVCEPYFKPAADAAPEEGHDGGLWTVQLHRSGCWSWYRLGGAELQRVGAEEELTLGRAGDSGEYQCRAYTDTQGLTQENTSLAHRVNIIPLPVGVPLGTAGFVLAFLCLCLLLLLAVWLFMQRPIKTTALDKLANGSPTKGELRTDTGLTP